MPVLTLCLTTVGSFAVLFLSAKLIGHKQIAQLDFFDYITGITIGSIAAEMATELEEPWKPMIAMVIYGGITLALSLIRRMGLDRTWLDKQLKQRHISSAKEVFLAVCDRNLKFVLFKK
ncbi:hypothetical protein B5F98_04935 [Pseudoflavonifractor sp. An44]|uniref:hypothetical protein n=1 Tax=Pseudoflavonifractor sp. An44 TaxID=1965635 RepID=UPI000B373933|nr:hypothetical protein [Pseudoflavonifractor sp. An44]OUN98544.1 hypothetical protein B5F98_04935 [Pseudoflavonifractor sp. An44]